MQKAIALLSGGFDSPIAIHVLQNKLDIVAIHFHQMPLTNEKEIEKVKKLADHLKIKTLYIVPFADVFKTIVENANHRNYYILSKIAMFHAAEMIAKEQNIQFLISGENLAQVSSQTLSNLHSITANVDMTILRPLLCWDKQDIIDKARGIESFEISKGPELCSLLGPPNPATKSNPQKIKEEYEGMKIEDTIKKAIEKKETYSSSISTR